MTDARLLLGREAGVATVVINRPEKLNALDAQTMDEMLVAVRELSDRRRCRGRGAHRCG